MELGAIAVEYLLAIFKDGPSVGLYIYQNLQSTCVPRKMPPKCLSVLTFCPGQCRCVNFAACPSGS